MEYLYIGRIVNTHGIKGELRILSDAEYKECIFQKGVHLYIGKDKIQKTISTYRFHKIYDMITLEGLKDINDALIYKGMDVYISRDEVTFPSFLKTDLIGMDVIASEYRGKVTAILTSKAHDILVIQKEQKKFMVPYVNAFIEKIDLENQKIYIRDRKGLFDED